jgi:recombination protein RecT
MNGKVNSIEVFRSDMQRFTPEIAPVLPPNITPEKFARVAITAVQNKPELLTADRHSLFAALMKCAEDGLVPDNREATLVIFKSKSRGGSYVPKASYIPMIRGLVRKLRESGEISDVYLEAVFPGDVFEYQLGDTPRIKHIPMEDHAEDAMPTHVYSVIRYSDGQLSRKVMAWKKVMEIRDRYALAKDHGPWYDNRHSMIEMGKKTVLRAHVKTQNLSTPLDRLLERDNDLYNMPQIAGTKPQKPNGVSSQAPKTADSVLSDFATRQPDAYIPDDEAGEEKQATQKDDIKKDFPDQIVVDMNISASGYVEQVNELLEIIQTQDDKDTEWSLGILTDYLNKTGELRSRLAVDVSVVSTWKRRIGALRRHRIGDATGAPGAPDTPSAPPGDDPRDPNA